MGMIRGLVAADAEAVAALIRTAFGAIGVPLDPAPSGLRMSAAAVLAAEGGAVWEGDDGATHGCVLWRARDGGLYVNRLAVRPGWQRRGIARALLAAAEAEGRARGMSRLVLEVRLALAGNRRLFRVMGFVEVSEQAHAGYAAPTFAVAEKWLV